MGLKWHLFFLFADYYIFMFMDHSFHGKPVDIFFPSFCEKVTIFLLMEKDATYILDRNSFSVIYVTNVFSKHVAYLFILLVLSFDEQKYF